MQTRERVWVNLKIQAASKGLHVLSNSTKLTRVFASSYINTGLYAVTSQPCLDSLIINTVTDQSQRA